MEYATLEAREATFVPPSKRSKVGGWPHKTPKSADLARAGFYYKPSTQSNDNVVCYLCNRNLDGWEANDDPVQEHLKHAEECGWALLMSIESQRQLDVSDMTDPTSEQYVDARRRTFAPGWPHESKRGWTCKTEKMVEAGWHFAPTSESEDYVSCAYCKLSLDGWEPKDNPFDEHYSRSPDCPFFVFAGTSAPSKRPKAKKGRASRTSRTSRVSRASARLSAQSNMTIQSDSHDIPALDESLDTSNVSLMSTASIATTKGKGKRKAAGGRSKSTKPKKAKTARSKKKEHTPEPDDAAEEEIVYPSIEDHSQPTQEQASIDEKQITPEKTQQTQAYEVPDPLRSPVESLGPPEREALAIPVQAPSPIPKVSAQPQSTPPRRTSDKPQQRRNTTKSDPELLSASPTASTSDIENAPPSTRPVAVRPPLSSPGAAPPRWTAADVEMIFESTSTKGIFAPVSGQNTQLSEPEKQMTVQDWIKYMASMAEENLRIEGERVVGIFENEGQRALNVLESIVCV